MSHDPHLLFLQVQLLSKYDELEQMMVNLNMTVVGHPPLSSADIFPGLLCCASSSIDKRWYRAVVISAHDVSGVVSLCVREREREEGVRRVRYVYVWEGGRVSLCEEEGYLCLNIFELWCLCNP